jgi:hypothetical protein
MNQMVKPKLIPKHFLMLKVKLIPKHFLTLKVIGWQTQILQHLRY